MASRETGIYAHPKVAMLVTDDAASRAFYRERLRRSFTAVKVADTMENVLEQIANSVQAVLVTLGNDHLDSKNIFEALRESTSGVPFYFLEKVNTINMEMARIPRHLPNPPIYAQFNTEEDIPWIIKSTMKTYMATIERIALLVTDKGSCEELYTKALECICTVKKARTIEDAQNSFATANLVIITLGHDTVDASFLFFKLRAENREAPFIFVDKSTGFMPPMLNLLEYYSKQIARHSHGDPNAASHIPYLGEKDFEEKICEMMGWNLV